MTLIEMTVVLAVIGLLAGALTIGYGRLPATALKREAVHMAAILRSAYDRATASGAHHRVVLDLDQGSYQLERCEGKVDVRRARDLREELDRQKQDAEQAAEQAAQAQQQGPDGMLQGLVANAGKTLGGSGGSGATKCTPVKGDMGQANRLGGHPKVGFAKVWVGHLDEPVKDGQVTINFYPLGSAEKAVIVLATDEENRFSIALQPISGRIDMMQGEMRRADDYMATDATGERQQ